MYVHVVPACNLHVVHLTLVSGSASMSYTVRIHVASLSGGFPYTVHHSGLVYFVQFPLIAPSCTPVLFQVFFVGGVGLRSSMLYFIPLQFELVLTFAPCTCGVSFYHLLQILHLHTRWLSQPLQEVHSSSLS